MMQRLGVGSVRHLEVNPLWIQDRVRRGDIEIEKVGGKSNIADALTKYVDRESLEVHIRGSSLRQEEGRHTLAPAVLDEEIVGRFVGNNVNVVSGISLRGYR